MTSPLRVCITGASTDIGQSVAYMVAQGRAFGKDRRLVLILCDSPLKQRTLQDGMAKELSMCLLSNLTEIEVTTSLEVALTGADAVFLCSGVVPNPGFSRNDIISLNALEYKSIGLAFSKVKCSGHILVVSEPPNTNMAVLAKFAPELKAKSVTGLIKVEQNRSASYLARRLDIAVDKVRKLAVWGNKSRHMVMDLTPCVVEVCDTEHKVREAIKDDHFIKNSFMESLTRRKMEVENRRKTTSCLPVASAAIQHMRAVFCGTPARDWCSMVVQSDGSYGVDEGLPYSFPVTVAPGGGDWEIVQGLDQDIELREALDEAQEEVKAEVDFAWTVLGLKKVTKEEEGEEEEVEARKPWSFGMGQVVPCSVIKPLEQERMATF